MTDASQAFDLFNEIGIINQLAGTLLERALPTGMTRAQFTVLNHFRRLQVVEKSPAALADAFQVTRPTMTSTLARMLEQGLISIRPDPLDGRAKLVSITDAGRQMCLDCIAATRPMLEDLSGRIAGLDVPQMTTELRVLRKILDENR